MKINKTALCSNHQVNQGFSDTSAQYLKKSKKRCLRQVEPEMNFNIKLDLLYLPG